MGLQIQYLGKPLSPLKMDGRRVRRFGIERGRGHIHTHNTRSLLPLSTTQPHHDPSPPSTISCWYCDYKILSLNGPLFRLGRRHARILRAWFSIGVGFGITALLAVSMVYSLTKPIFLLFFYHCIYVYCMCHLYEFGFQMGWHRFSSGN